MYKYRIVPEYKTVWHKNKLSGHEWPTSVNTGRFELCSNCHPTRIFYSLEAAERTAKIYSKLFKGFDPNRENTP